jgi:hypothetical protein
MLEKLHLRGWLGRSLLGFVALIVMLRALAPLLVERFVNDKLADLDGYTGHVDDIDLHLWRGAYEAEGLVIDKTGGKVPVPFLAIERMDLGVEWGALFDGEIVARVSLFRPQLNFVKGPTEATTQAGTEADWKQTVEELVPMSINKFSVVDGEIHYRDFHSAPKVDVLMDHLDATVSNLTNSKELSGSRVADIQARATVMRSGRLSVKGQLDPFADQPTFELETSLERLRLPQLNAFLKAYVNVDVEKGSLSLYSVLRSKQGNFRGYVKPMVEGLDVLRWKEEDERPIEKLWQALVGGAAELLENQPNDRLATRIPLSGHFNQPDVNGWTAALSLLRNAFIEALRHGLDPRST